MERPFDNDSASPLPASLWANVTPSGVQHPPLQESIGCDVTIIGAGFAGLSAALALAEEKRTVVVLEASETGWGASGRNNGLIAPGLKLDPDEVIRQVGDQTGERLIQYSGNAPARLSALIEKHDIDCDLSRNGWIQAARTDKASAQMESRVRQWQMREADVAMLEHSEVASILGTRYYTAASIDRRGGSLNPLAYVRGLDRAASTSGARIFWHSPVSSVTRSGERWKVASGNTHVVSKVVLVCTNAYGELAQTRANVLPVRTAQVASHPLHRDQLSTILPGGESCSDTQRLLTSFRVTADRRLIMGGADATAGDHHAGLAKSLHASATERFPQLGPIEWEYDWSGYLAITPDHLPMINTLGESFYFGVGCNGRGIAMATSTGQCLAALALGEQPNNLSIPVREPRKFPGYALRRTGVAAAVRFNRLLDRLEI